MSKRRTRPIFFVCSALSNNKELLSEMLQALSLDEAVKVFKDKHQITPESVFGPLYKKRTQALENTTNIVYSNQNKKAEYNGWAVNAHILKKPENHAMLIFNKRLDDKNLPKPQGIIVVPIYDLRFV
jgi:hypothetical protein